MWCARATSSPTKPKNGWTRGQQGTEVRMPRNKGLRRGGGMPGEKAAMHRALCRAGHASKWVLIVSSRTAETGERQAPPWGQPRWLHEGPGGREGAARAVLLWLLAPQQPAPAPQRPAAAASAAAASPACASCTAPGAAAGAHAAAGTSDSAGTALAQRLCLLHRARQPVPQWPARRLRRTLQHCYRCA